VFFIRLYFQWSLEKKRYSILIYMKFNMKGNF